MPETHEVVPARFAEFGKWGYYEKDLSAEAAANWADLDPQALKGLADKIGAKAPAK
jgi:hypothetical protein